MEIRSILINVDFNAFSPAIASFASSLADRFDAKLVAVAAAPLVPAFIDVNSVEATADFFDKQAGEIDEKLGWLRDQFATHLAGGVELDWHGLVASTNKAVVSLAERADLIVAAQPGRSFPRPGSVDLGDLVLAAGRPVLVAPVHADAIDTKIAVVAWKDTREARRAVADALPFLRLADRVHVAVIEEGGDHNAELGDVLAWLETHGIAADGRIHTNVDGVAQSLSRVARSIGAGIVVSGAYGRGRMQELLFGGATRGLLATHDITRLMSS